MIEIAILGLGTVGGGTADLLESHKESIAKRIGDEIHIKYILDIRDLPESPYYDRIVHDYNIILNDPEVQIVAELIGGSQREERMENLLEAIERFGLNPEDYWWYIELRKYGGTKHAGFGLGFERLIMYITGMSNIRDVEAFPRTTGSADF